MAKRSYTKYESKAEFLKDLKKVVELAKDIRRGELVYAVRSLMENNAGLFDTLTPGDVKAKHFENAYVSQEAYKVLQCEIAHEHHADEGISFETLGLHYEHVVPATTLYDGLCALTEDANSTESDFEGFIEKHFIICVITDEENERLNKAGLRQTMPDDWKQGGDAWARYNAVEPKIICKKYGEFLGEK